MKRHLAILLSSVSPDQPHRCAAPFMHAAAAAAMDTEVEIHFTGPSVNLLRRGVAEALPSGPRARETVASFMHHALEHGAQFIACSEALAEHELTGAALADIPFAVAGAASFVSRVLDEDWATLVY